MNLGPAWTDERIKILKHHVSDGLSATQIGAAMGISRNAAIGKLHRMGVRLARASTVHRVTHVARPAPDAAAPKLPVRSAPFRPPPRFTRPVGPHTQIRPNQNSQRRKEVMVIEATEIIDLAPDESAFACTIADLGPEHGMNRCRWPLGPPAADMEYCGAESSGPWCGRHRAIVYKPYPRRA